MMKLLPVVALFGSVMLSGCVSYVKTFDGNGTKLGECTSFHGYPFGGGASCSGSANPKDLR
jgi:hypothetical protein